MKESYVNYAGIDLHEESDVMIRLKVLAAEIYKERAYGEYILRQMFPSTAVGEYLDLHAAERGLTRKPATKAGGNVWFYPAEETHETILIPAGTVVCSYIDMHRFTTDADATLNAGDERVLVHITAVEPGADYNVRAGTITMIVTPVPGIGEVYNSFPYSNGADTESDDDLRARVTDSYVNIGNGANAAYYKSLAMSVSCVADASVVGLARGAGTVDVYVIGANGEELNTTQMNEVQALLTQNRELNVDVRACAPEMIEVSLYIRLQVKPGYDFDAVAAEVQQTVTGFINNLGIGRDLKLSEVGEVIYHIKGVSDYHFTESYGSDCLISNAQYAYADHIVVREG